VEKGTNKENTEGFTTQIIHSDRRKPIEHDSLHRPIHTSITYEYAEARDIADVFQGKASGYTYGRQVSPTTSALEDKITLMENGLSTTCFSTGMAAITAVMLSLLRQGDHFISSAYLFGNTNSFFNTLTNFGIEVSFVDATDVQQVKAAIRPNTKAVFVETIANPCTQVADLEGIGALCEQQNLLYIVDNTITSPFLFQPKTVKAGLIINSLSKCISGHGNVLGGAVTETGLYDWSSFENIYDDYKKGDVANWGMLQIKKKGLRDTGGTLSPKAAHDIGIGAETLALRQERSGSNALAVARYCNAHPRVKRVLYPGLEIHPEFARAKSLFRNSSFLLSVELEDGIDCFDFLNALKIVVITSNLGDNRTLAIPVAQTIFYEMGVARRESMGISDNMIRLSIGIEDERDLLNDIEQALTKC